MLLLLFSIGKYFQYVLGVISNKLVFGDVNSGKMFISLEISWKLDENSLRKVHVFCTYYNMYDRSICEKGNEHIWNWKSIDQNNGTRTSMQSTI